MILFLLAYLGGVLTIISPCILPVLPFVFARADRPFLRSGLPLLLGMALTFAAVATLAAVGGGWAVQANAYGRIAALVVLAAFGLLLLFPALADRATRPLVALGGRLSQSADRADRGASSFFASLLLGVATGLLWAPCAGPVLGLVLTGAALQGASAHTSLLLLAYAAGAATSLALALLVGGKVFAAMKRSIGVGERIRKALGVAVLVGVVAIALGLDTGLLTRLSLSGTARFEQGLLDRFHQDDAMSSAAMGKGGQLVEEGRFPSLAGVTEWIGSPPLTPESLRGKVVLVDFWTYSCINCLRSLPYVRAWAEKYRDQGLVVIGVHTPEFAFEKDPANVRKAVGDLGIAYPVAIDNDHGVWRAFRNRYWPAHYFIDGKGRIRYHHFGEGDYAQSERVIQRLLAENGSAVGNAGTVTVSAIGAGAAAGQGKARSPETYLGYGKAMRFASPGGLVRDTRHDYAAPASPQRDAWGLAGEWSVGREQASLDAAGGRIVYRFHARDVHLVLGPARAGRAVRFRVTIDGQAPGADHGADVDPRGNGLVDGQRLYQLVRMQGGTAERTFAIEFLDPGVQAFAFTFG
ncbi:cytochrome c biogenesis protein DipZ [Novosphingobium resinovorum]|uniref:Redoxin domain-containing protein n=1 Tax=Novosphingobium resinovorum TaxID=158500 RepID=A0A031JQS5_9SPHN|nr:MULTISPECIES: cytochrome c biogenesis protein DipZ [Sphingomonadaceae]EJU11214.1 redoxin domain-containing protein [Sphingomonas sp. LH128]EZP76613.1 Redoxin domain-containing protein [Novosphingobium resinovorum]MBF7013966.1 cytochrome c biogenesis protein DipZ [Novosphingobium sp. HR1a]WJM26107.1 cytochrome c biogenesis protein DipZ [Novosphingobium resinovorum]